MASEPARLPEKVCFGEDFELDFRLPELRRGGHGLKLERIPLELLLLLVEHRNQIVTREQIADRIWGAGVFLDTDNSINSAIRKIRQVLKDNPDQPRFIQTVMGKGYRFIAPIIDPVVHSAPALSPAALPPIGLPRAFVRRWWAIPILLLLAVAAWLVVSRYHFPRKPAGGRTMLAVLPFENLTGDASQDYLSEGITEEMITQLGRFDPQRMGVIARTSVLRYEHDHVSVEQIGRDLGVQYVLEGSVRRGSNRVRVTAQLIQVQDQTHLWADEYDREVKDILVVQGEIAQQVLDEIERALGKRQGNERASAPQKSTAFPSSYEAYDSYLKGRYFWNKRTADGFRQAVKYFQQAVDQDPSYARGYAGLADTYALMSTWSEVPQNEFMPKARAAAFKALELDESLAEAHTSLALIAESYDYDWQTAEKEFQRAIELSPEYATAHQWYAEHLSWRGRFDEALAESERARQLDPMSLIIATDHAAILYYSRQYDRAIAQCRAVLVMDPSFPRARDFMIGSYVQQGKYAEALEAIGHSPVPDDSPWTWVMKAYVYGRWGRTAESRHALSKFEELAPRQQLDRTPWLSVAYSVAGQKDQLIALLQQAYSEHSHAVVGLKVDPIYDPLRGDPRFQELLRRVGLAQ